MSSSTDDEDLKERRRRFVEMDEDDGDDIKKLCPAMCSVSVKPLKKKLPSNPHACLLNQRLRRLQVEEDFDEILKRDLVSEAKFFNIMQLTRQVEESSLEERNSPKRMKYEDVEMDECTAMDVCTIIKPLSKRMSVESPKKRRFGSISPSTSFSNLSFHTQNSIFSGNNRANVINNINNNDGTNNNDKHTKDNNIGFNNSNELSNGFIFSTNNSNNNYNNNNNNNDNNKFSTSTNHPLHKSMLSAGVNSAANSDSKLYGNDIITNDENSHRDSTFSFDDPSTRQQPQQLQYKMTPSSRNVFIFGSPTSKRFDVGENDRSHKRLLKSDSDSSVDADSPVFARKLDHR